MADIQAQIQAKLEALAAELSEIYRSAVREAVEQVLGGGGPAAAPRARGRVAPSAPAGRRKRARKGGRRSSEEIAALADKILAHIKSNPGQGAEAIKSALDIAKSEWLRPIGKLVEEKKIRTTGKKRSTKYFPAGGEKKTRKKKAKKEE